MSETYNQEINLNLKATDNASSAIRKTASSLSDFSKEALLSAEHLSKLFSKEQIKEAENYATVFRNFNSNLKQNVARGLRDIFTSDDAKALGNAFSQLTSSQTNAIVNFFEEPQKVLNDLSESAVKGAKHLSEVFTKEDIDRASAMAKAMRDFNEGWKENTSAGIDMLDKANTVDDLAKAFSNLTSTQTSTIKGLFDKPKEAAKELYDFTERARTASNYMSNMFSAEDVQRAREIANSLRSFNESWEGDTGKGLLDVMKAQTVEKLGEAFSEMTSSQASALSALFTEAEDKTSLFARYWDRVTTKARSSLKSFERSIDRIANIIRYRIIRQGLSLIVSQLNEGTRSVYVFARAFSSIDQNHIAEKLDGYATALDRIRGNLGAAWATTLANLSNLLMPMLDKISEAIEKITAFSSALAGNSTYAKVAADNIKRYYDVVASGLQDIKVIGGGTRFDMDAEIPEDTINTADRVRKNLEDIGDITGGALVGLGIMLIATGHIVAGLGLAGAALGISKVTNDLDDANTIGDKVKGIFNNVGSMVNSIELGLGLMLLSHGQWKYGIPLILAGGSGALRKLGDVDINSDLSKAFSGISLAIDTISLGLGAVLCAYGQYGLGVPLLVTGLVGITEATMTNWDDIMDLFEELGLKIKVWWWNLWNGDIYSTWEEQFDAYVKAHLDEFPVGNETLNFGATQLPGFGGYSPLSGNNSTVEEEEKSFWKSAGEVFSNIGDKIGKVFNRSVEGYKLRYGLTEFADGGFPSAGSLFLAGEVPGQTELLGTINGRTGVAGGAEITGIREAIYEVGAEILNGMAQNRPIVNIEGDADRMFQVVREKSRDYTRRTGEFAF